ncbi:MULTISPECIES: DUF4387 domain-containing protein [Thalassobaculum]|uniref:DUF4387 domain-containing protein n=1 Tax=Thalassobaculum litoreum DSM 18839 TaxID=1123362 RepID=A0A8G2BLM2_9PROT|nr:MULTISPECIES: DUF4387 domain-containing protein [Thalassobaculum]SDG35005.1 protein of unknown function [Thalassobaculum litoreum DSM 18839]
MPRIRDIAKVCKSKNAGPFQLTIDVVFETRATYDAVAATGVLTPALIAGLYDVDEEDVLFTPYPAGLAFKATIPRHIPAGDLGDTDVYGCQQHAPMLDVDIPINDVPVA